LIEPVVGLADVGTIEFVGAAVPAVGSALGDQLHLGAGRSPRIRVGVRGGHAKLFDRVQGGTHRSLESKAVALVVIVDAVERDVGLVAASAVGGSGTRVK